MVATDVRQEIDQALRRWESNFNSGDMASLAAMYTADGTLMPPDTEMIRGRAGIEAFWRAAQEGGVRQIKLVIGDVFVNGDVAVETSRGFLTVQTGDSAPLEVPVKYVVVWTKSGEGGWELAVDIWNSTQPA